MNNSISGGDVPPCVILYSTYNQQQRDDLAAAT